MALSVALQFLVRTNKVRHGTFVGGFYVASYRSVGEAKRASFEAATISPRWLCDKCWLGLLLFFLATSCGSSISRVLVVSEILILQLLILPSSSNDIILPKEEEEFDRPGVIGFSSPSDLCCHS